MGRSRFLLIFAGIIVAALCWPAASLAGTYSWDMPGNFTATGANPDHDAYGATPWSYVEGAVPAVPLGLHSHDPSTFTALPTFTADTRGGVRGWTDTGDPDALVGANVTSDTESDGTDSFPGQELVLTPPADRLVAVGWTSPLFHSATVHVTGSVAGADTGACALKTFSWSLDQNGSPLLSGLSGAPISASPTVPAGGSLYLTIDASGIYDAECDTATAVLHITVDETTGPQVSLFSPAPNALISGGQPEFAGRASTAFGAVPSVRVRIYNGTSPSGTPVQTLTAGPSSTGGFSVGANASLPDGQYTAQVEQDDLSSPPDAGLSVPVTFVIHNSKPAVTLDSPKSEPVTTSTPTFTGTAGTGPGDGHAVTLVVYPGSGTNGKPMRFAEGPVDSSGHFSIRVAPGLSDGTYTVVALQSGSGGAGLSRAVTFRIQGGTAIGGGGVIGPKVSVSSSGAVTTTVSCPAATLAGCAGDVLVVTQRSYRPRVGGPSGPLRVLFAYVTVAAGKSVTIERAIPADIAAFLRRAKSVRVRVTATLNANSRSTATRTLTFSR